MAIDSKSLSRLERNDRTLTSLNLSNQGLKAADIKALAKTLEQNTFLTELDLSGNALRDEGAELLLACKGLRTLKLNANHISEKGALALAQHPTITTLHLSQNPITNAGFKALTQNKMLTSLVVADCQINSDGISRFADPSALTILDLSNNQINDEGCLKLTENKQLISLKLSTNQITDKGITALAQLSHLTVLDMSYNSVGVSGAKVLAEMPLQQLNLNYNNLGEAGTAFIAKNTSITWLSIAGNGINDPGMAALSKNRQLRYLDVSYNHISDEGAGSLLENHTLHELNINYNEITQQGCIAIVQHPALIKLSIAHNLLGDLGASAIAKSITILWLNVAGNKIGWAGAKALGSNTHLKTLLLSYNPLGDIGAIFLAQNKTLTELGLSYTKMKDAGAIALAENQTLKRLTVNYNYIGEEGQSTLKQNKHFEQLIMSQEQPPEFTEDNLNTIFLLSQNFLCVRGSDGKIEFFNPAFSRVLGYTDDELLGKSYLEFLHPDDRQKESDDIMPQQQTIPIVRYINRYRCKDGTYRLVEWSSQSKHNRIYAMGVDITAQKQAEHKLVYAERQAATQRLQQTELYNQRQSNFIATLCHELRNPLSGIQGSIDIIGERFKQLMDLLTNQHHLLPPDIVGQYQQACEKITESLQDVQICIDHEETILNDNLDITKIEEGKLELANKVFDLKKAIQEACQILKAKADKKGLAFILQLPQEAMPVKGDGIRIKQIVINLVSNAIKFTEKGSLTIALFIQEQAATYTSFEIRVTDTGIGMTQEETQKLFDRFAQASIENQYGGSGLGLLIAKDLAALMKGTITVESEKGKGTTFHCFIQCHNLLAQEQLPPERKQTAAAALVKPTAHTTVLIVDDNEINRKTLGFMLQKAGYVCLFAENGKAAIAIYEQQRPQVVLMDVLMPVMDGLTATRSIRHYENEKGLTPAPIIAITGNALEQQRQEALDAGMNDYTAKPFKKDIILERISNLLAVTQTNSKSTRLQSMPIEKQKTSTQTPFWHPPQTEMPPSTRKRVWMAEDLRNLLYPSLDNLSTDLTTLHINIVLSEIRFQNKSSRTGWQLYSISESDEHWAILNLAEEAQVDRLIEAINQSQAQLQAAKMKSNVGFSLVLIFSSAISLSAEVNKIKAYLPMHFRENINLVQMR